MFVFYLTLQFFCCSAIIAQHMSKFPIASHFKPSELANLTSHEEYQLQLKTLLHKDMSITVRILLLELLAKNTGNEFYGFVDDEKANRDCTAIVNAVFACMGKLPVQFHANSAYQIAFYAWIMQYIGQARGHFGKAVYLLSSGMDVALRNETIYTTLREEYNKSESGQPKKLLMYGIPKSENELRIAIAELLNYPQSKKYIANMICICGT